LFPFVRSTIVENGIINLPYGNGRHAPIAAEDQARAIATIETADFFGFADRGRLATGLRADVNPIDFDRLRLHQPEVVDDLPAGGRRLVQRVDGYRATLVAGTAIFENGEDTGARPGRLVRARRS
jgi:N-acyl-D-aspartate/D-glutamate deacylase